MTLLNRYAGLLAAIAIILALVGWYYPAARENVQPSVGQITDTFTGDIFDAGTSFKLNGTAFYTSSGLNTGTTNTATTTTAVGCIQTTATSTATPIKLQIGSSTVATGTFSNVSGAFFVFASFGSCP